MGKWCGPPHGEMRRCGAHAKGRGEPCLQYAMANGRCRWHGGKSTGAKNPHRNIKHGLRTKEAIEEKRQLAALLKSAKGTLELIK